MRFHPTALAGAFLIEPVLHEDERGFFARTFCREELGREGLVTDFVQHSISFSRVRGTVRGMHFQRPPHQEVKVVSCAKGAIRDVIVDLRPDSPTFGKWQGFDLTARNRLRLYIPAGFAHGLQTLEDETEVEYLISTFYTPAAADGVRHDDPAFGIRWPLPVAVISERDRQWPDFRSPTRANSASVES